MGIKQKVGEVFPLRLVLCSGETREKGINLGQIYRTDRRVIDDVFTQTHQKQN